MAKFMCWPDNETDFTKAVDASNPQDAAVAWCRIQNTGDWGDGDVVRVSVSDEEAVVHVVQVRVGYTTTYTPKSQQRVPVAELAASDPMPTPAAEALRDAKFAGRP